MTPPTLSDVEAFLYEEAHLLDAGKFKDWLALYTDDCYYWMPVSPDETARGQGVSLQNADKQFLEISVNRLYLASAHSMLPKRRECRVVSNVSLVCSDDPTVTVVRSKLIVHEYRVRELGNDDQRTLAATVLHGLRGSGQALSIAWKRVDLISSEASLSAMPIPL